MKKEEFMKMTEAARIEYFNELAENARGRKEKNQTAEKMAIINKKLEEHERLTIEEFETLTGIRFHHDMSGKMFGILAIGSNCLMNPICIERMKDGNSICSECYAAALEMYRKGLAENTSYNFKVLTSVLIPEECIPVIDADELRVEPYGDTANEIQAANYIQFAMVNNNIAVTAWTKNVSHYKKALKLLGMKRKPDNFTLIKSSKKKNTEEKILPSEKGLVDKTFSGFTLEWLKAHNLDSNFINCGGRNCKACQRCYKKAKQSEIHIHELLKSDTKKAEKSGFEWTDNQAVKKETSVNNETATRYANMF